MIKKWFSVILLLKSDFQLFSLRTNFFGQVWCLTWVTPELSLAPEHLCASLN